jgi:predicted transcriptional regulator YdeE
MQLQPIVIESINLIGIETRTKNSDEITGNGKIPQLIQSFYGDLLHKIPDRDGSQILAVYTDYESDENGEYTYFLGARVNNLSRIPDGMVGRTIPSALYQVIPSEQGTIPEIVLKVWQSIWQNSGIKKIRAYTTDFELYDEQSLASGHTQVDVYISIIDM